MIAMTEKMMPFDGANDERLLRATLPKKGAPGSQRAGPAVAAVPVYEFVSIERSCLLLESHVFYNLAAPVWEYGCCCRRHSSPADPAK